MPVGCQETSRSWKCYFESYTELALDNKVSESLSICRVWAHVHGLASRLISWGWRDLFPIALHLVNFRGILELQQYSHTKLNKVVLFGEFRQRIDCDNQLRRADDLSCSIGKVMRWDEAQLSLCPQRPPLIGSEDHTKAKLEIATTTELAFKLFLNL